MFGARRVVCVDGFMFVGFWHQLLLLFAHVDVVRLVRCRHNFAGNAVFNVSAKNQFRQFLQLQVMMMMLMIIIMM